MPFPEIGLETYVEYSDVFDDSVFALFDIESALSARTAAGAPSPENVSAQLAGWRKKLG